MSPLPSSGPSNVDPDKKPLVGLPKPLLPLEVPSIVTLFVILIISGGGGAGERVCSGGRVMEDPVIEGGEVPNVVADGTGVGSETRVEDEVAGVVDDVEAEGAEGAGVKRDESGRIF